MTRLTDYSAIEYDKLAPRYVAGESARALAAECGCRDHKTFSRHLAPYVEAIGGRMRSQAESQGARRHKERQDGPAMDRLTLDDVRNWYDATMGARTTR